jgi:hypothetical protein
MKSVVTYKSVSESFSLRMPKEMYKEQVKAKLKLNQKMIEDGFEIYDFNNGAYYEKFIVSNKINRKFYEDNFNSEAGFTIEKMKEKFVILDAIKIYIPFALKKSLKKGSLVYNSKLIRLVNEPYLTEKEIRIQEVDYFQGMCTNEIVFMNLKSKSHLGSAFKGETLLIDDGNFVYPLEESLCANYIGVSTLAITKDGYMVINSQGEKSNANARRFSPSGSGSSKYKDYTALKDREGLKLKDLLIYGMEREIAEECNLAKLRYDVRTYVIGYCRLIERGGKLDFFGLSFIDKNFDEINKNMPTDKSSVNSREMHLGAGITKVKLGTEGKLIIRIADAIDSFIKENPEEKKISIQIHLISMLLHDLIDAGYDAFE